MKRRWLLVLPLAALAVFPQEPLDEIDPPEEDESLRPKEYSFNPLQADKELKVGAFHMKRGNFRGAAARFEEATKWNPGLADAWRRLGEAQEKLNDRPAAIAAYKKFLEAAPDGKPANDVKKRLAALNAVAKRSAK